jgi:hypothetical protein
MMESMLVFAPLCPVIGVHSVGSAHAQAHTHSRGSSQTDAPFTPLTVCSSEQAGQGGVAPDQPRGPITPCLERSGRSLSRP